MRKCPNPNKSAASASRGIADSGTLAGGTEPKTNGAKANRGAKMTKKLLVVATLVASALWAQQGNVIYPIAQQHLEGGTRTDMAPKFEAPSNIRVLPSVNFGSGNGDTRSRIEPYDASKFKSDNCPMTMEEGQRYARAAQDLQYPNEDVGLIQMVTGLNQIRQVNADIEARCASQGKR